MPRPIDRREIEKLKANAARLEKQVKTLKNTLSQLRTAHEKTSDALSKALSDKQALASENDAKLRSFNATIKEHVAENKRLTKENEKIPVLVRNNTDLKRRIVALETALKGKEQYIKTLSDNNITLKNEKAALAATIKQKDSHIKKLDSDLAAADTASKQQKDHYEKLLQSKEQAISTLEAKIAELRNQGELDKDLIREHEKLKLQYKTLMLEHDSREKEHVKLTAELTAMKQVYVDLEKENETNQGLLLLEQKEKNKYKQELTTLTKKLKSAFSPNELSQYFMTSIDDFNSRQSSSNSSVDYIIGEMDVELRADLGKADTDEMVLASPGFLTDTEHGLSSIKFSIRAVPKISEDEMK